MRRGRGTVISLYDPLPPIIHDRRSATKNIVTMAVKVKEYMLENPQKTQTDAGYHFGVSRARISQLIKIVNNLSPDFTKKLQETNDQILLRQFSGKALLRIASLMTNEQINDAINDLTSYESSPRVI
jgi:hypothetical protein